MITSKSNELIKKIKSLSLKKYRDNYKEYIVEGIKMALEAIDMAEVTSVVYCDELLSADDIGKIKRAIKSKKLSEDVLVSVSKNVFKYISDTITPQGVIAVVKMNSGKFDSSNEPIFILDNIQDPGNLGTIIRSLDAAGIHTLVLSKDTVDYYNLKVIRSTMGGIFRLNIIKLDKDLSNFVDELKKNKYKILATSLEGSKPYFDIPYNKCAIVMGNESQGVSKDIIKKSNCLIKIPMPGKTESLNVSVATSIIAFEIVRQGYKK